MQHLHILCNVANDVVNRCPHNIREGTQLIFRRPDVLLEMLRIDFLVYHCPSPSSVDNMRRFFHDLEGLRTGGGGDQWDMLLRGLGGLIILLA